MTPSNLPSYLRKTKKKTSNQTVQPTPRLNSIAKALDVNVEQANEFVAAVYKIAGRGKLTTILNCITEYKARTPQEVATLIRDLPRESSNTSELGQIAQVLGLDIARATEFVGNVFKEAVRKLIGRPNSKQILKCITEHDARTPEEVVKVLKQMRLSVPKRRTRKISGKPRSVSKPRFVSRPRFVWNPDTGSIESVHPSTEPTEPEE